MKVRSWFSSVGCSACHGEDINRAGRGQDGGPRLGIWQQAIPIRLPVHEGQASGRLGGNAHHPGPARRHDRSDERLRRGRKLGIKSKEDIPAVHGKENPLTITAADFVVQGQDRRPGSLTFHLAGKRLALQIDVMYTLAEADCFIRKRLVIRSRPQEVYFIDQIAVQSFEIPGCEVRLGGFGQPVYTCDLFAGLEYPAAYTTHGGHRVRAHYYSGQTTGAGAITTE